MGVEWRALMKTSLQAAVSCLALGLFIAGCGSSDDGANDDALAESQDALSNATGSFVSHGTGYYPDGSALEGGFVDRKGVRLKTLQQFLAGQSEYVSVAMDSSAFGYGQHLRIKELDAKYGRAIDFRVVDTGGAFRGRGKSRIDICVANRKASLDPTVNGTLHVEAKTSFSSSPPSSPTTSPQQPPPVSAQPGSDPGESPPGKACAGDGTCNPGNDGAGQICTAGHCVAGCRSNAQCPGATQCKAGQCQ